MRYREVAQKLTRLECQEITRKSKGSHRKWLNPSNQRAAIIPDWGSKDLKFGILKAIIKQFDTEWQGAIVQSFQDWLLPILKESNIKRVKCYGIAKFIFKSFARKPIITKQRLLNIYDFGFQAH